ncbi:SLC5 family protein [Fontivita pretiosa]|uniref:SLC5 family protein n=1 Tax=Fontivita pretiosa TaxID=2989684 RepID=UPI003D17A3D0
MNRLDLLIVAASLLIVLVIGLWAARRRSETAEGYFLASGKMPWWIIGSAFVSTSVSSEQIVGTVGAAYSKGMLIANWEWWTLPTYLLLIVLFIPLYLHNRVTTVADLLDRRFGPLCRDLYSWVMLGAYVVVFLVPVLYGGSLAISQLIHWPEDLAPWGQQIVLWMMLALVAAYTVKGGLVSVMWTDAVQCLMLVGGGLVLFFYALSHVPGGWQAMVEARPDRFRLYQPPNDADAPFLGLVAASLGVFLFYQAGNQVMVQRVLGARSTWDGMMGIIFAGFINLLRPLVTCFLGFVVYHWIHVMGRSQPLDNPDLAFPFVLRTLSPEWGLRGIVLAGFVAAVMSTLSALSNSTATLFSLEVYRKLIAPHATDRQTVVVGRIASLAALVLAAALAPLVPKFGGIFRYFQTAVTYLATPFISVMLLGIFWKRTTYAAAVVGIIGGLVIQIALGVWLPRLWTDLHWLYIAFIAQVLTMALVVAASLLSPPPPEHRWRPFLWRPALLWQLSSGTTGRAWYQSLWLWGGTYAAIWIGIYAWFW